MDYFSWPKEKFVIYRDRYGYGPFPAIYYNIDWITPRAQKMFGAKLTVSIQTAVGAYHEGRERFIMGTKEDADAAAASITKRVLEEPRFISELQKGAKHTESKWRQFLRDIVSGTTSLSTVAQIKAAHRQWIWFYGEYGFWNAFVWIFGADAVFNGVKAHLQARYPLTHEEYLVVVAPRESSYAVVEERELSALGRRIDRSLPLETQPDRANKLLELHARKWGWLPWDYIGPDVWDAKKILDRLKSLREDTSPEPNRVSQKQRHIIKKYDMRTSDQRIVKDVQTLTLMPDEKKALCTYAQFVLHNYIFKEIGKCIGIEQVQCSKFSEAELWDALDTGDSSGIKKKLKSRLEAVTTIYDADGATFIEGDAAIRFFEKFNEDTKSVTELRGQCASKGRVRGRVTVLRNPKQSIKMKSGDIIVTTMTTPDYLMAMKMAAAIVTEEGGLTSHAAIIARELGIPCIIGTKIATQVFKNGDMVEVDAEKGVVRIIARAASNQS